jgi:hypothetical protein
VIRVYALATDAALAPRVTKQLLASAAKGHGASPVAALATGISKRGRLGVPAKSIFHAIWAVGLQIHLPNSSTSHRV